MTYQYLVTVDIDTRVDDNIAKTMHDAHCDAIERYLMHMGGMTCDSHKVQVLVEPVQPGAGSFREYAVRQFRNSLAPSDKPFRTFMELKFFMLGVLVGTVIAALVLPK